MRRFGDSPIPPAIAALPLLTPGQLREADAILFHGTDLISDGIEQWTDSFFSHCGMATYDPRTAEWNVIEAATPQVRETPLRWYLSNYSNKQIPFPGTIVVYRWNGIAPQNAATATQFALRQRSIDYGTATDFEIAEYIASRGVLHPNLTIDGKTWICSELVQAAYSWAGLRINPTGDGVCVPNDISVAPQMRAIGRLSLDS